MKVLIDTNVLLDFYCQREDFYQPAADILDLACNDDIELWVSAISFVNFFYITRKEYTIEQRFEILRGLMQICHVAGADEQVIYSALLKTVPDFEDMVQYHSARSVSVDCIITRNVKDFMNADIPVMTPTEFLDKYYS